jgi:integrase
VFAWAVRSGIVLQNPLKGVELPARSDAMDYLTADEVRALLDTADAQAGALGLVERGLVTAIRFALYTGARKGEILALR